MPKRIAEGTEILTSNMTMTLASSQELLVAARNQIKSY